jgi:hypothetical protein
MTFDRRSVGRGDNLHERSTPTSSIPGKRTLSEQLTMSTVAPRPHDINPELMPTVGEPISELPRPTIESIFGGYAVQQARSPGKRTVNKQAYAPAVQQRAGANDHGHDAAAVHASAERGVATPGICVAVR